MELNDIIVCFNRFQTHNLDVRWINEVFENDFSESTELPADVKDVEWGELLIETYETLHKFVCDIQKAGNLSSTKCGENETSTKDSLINNDNSDECQLWVSLMDHGINAKGVLVILYSFINVSCTPSASFSEIDLGITAANIYLSLVCMPDSKAFGLFQPSLYRNVLDIFRQHTHLTEVLRNDHTTKGNHQRSKKAATVKLSQDDGNKQRRKRIRKDSELSAEDDSGKDNGEENVEKLQDDIPEFSTDQAFHLMKRMLELTNNLNTFINRFSLKSCAASLELTIERICAIINKMFAINSNLTACATEKSPVFVGLESKCLEILKSLCSPSCGKVAEIAMIIFRCLFDSLLNNCGRTLISFLCRLIDSVSPKDISNAIRSLIQNLCCKCPEKADYRTKVSSIVLVLMSRLPVADYVLLVKWFTVLLFTSKAGHRTMALEILLLVLGRPNLVFPDDMSPQDFRYITKSYILERILLACSDKAPFVRSKALSILATCITDSESEVQEVIVKLFTNTTNETTFISDAEEEQVPALNWKTVGEMLMHRTIDTNVFVRKAAVQGLHNALLMFKSCVCERTIKALKTRCLDVAVSVRKQALQSFNSLLLQYSELDFLYAEWLEGVLTAVLDPEPSIQEKCMELVEELIFNNIGSTSSLENSGVAWKVLNCICIEDAKGGYYERCLRKAIYLLSSAGRLRHNLISDLKMYLFKENSTSAWMLLAIIACNFKTQANSKIDAKLDFVWNYWDSNHESVISNGTPLIWILQIMGIASSKLKQERIKYYASTLTDILMEGRCPMIAIPAAVDVIAKFSGESRDEHSEKSILHTFCVTVFKNCSNYLGSTLLEGKSDSTDQNIELIAKHILTLGEVGQLRPKLIPKRMLLLIKSFLFLNNEDVLLESQFTNGINRLDIMKRIPQFVYLSIGKLCLCMDDLAKQCIPVLGQALANVSNPISVRRAILLILADLYVRYGTMVDSYLSVIIGCLKDSSEMIRSDTLIVLTSLLQEDYLKWRGSLYFALLISLVDQSTKIQHLTRYTIEIVLLKRQPKMFAMHFIECIYFFNAYQVKGGKGNMQSRTLKDSKLFSLAGQRKKRMKLYNYMLDHMTEDDRILTSARICKDILNEVIEGRIILRRTNGERSHESESLVRDALTILRSDVMQFTRLKNQEEAEEMETGETPNANPERTPAGRLIHTQFIRKNTVEIFVPMILACKQKFEEQQSSLIKDLMLYLIEVRKSYKNELQEMLEQDEQLRAEIEFDMRKQEQLADDENNSEDEDDCSVVNASICREPAVVVKEPVLNTALRTMVSSPAEAISPNNSNEQQSPVKSITLPLKQCKVLLEPLSDSIRRSGLSFQSPIVEVKRSPLKNEEEIGETNSSALNSTIRNTRTKTVPATPILTAIRRQIRKRSLDNVNTSTPQNPHSKTIHNAFENIATVMSPIAEENVNLHLRVDDEKSHYLVNLNGVENHDGKISESSDSEPVCKRRRSLRNLK